MKRDLIEAKPKTKPVQAEVDVELRQETEALMKVKGHSWRQIVEASLKYYILNGGKIPV